MGAVDTLDLQREECPLLDMQVFRREAEVFSGHLDCLTWYLGGVKAGRIGPNSFQTEQPKTKRADVMAGYFAEGEGIEPPSPCGRWFSRPLPYR
jgi:hypothetical protein